MKGSWEAGDNDERRKYHFHRSIICNDKQRRHFQLGFEKNTQDFQENCRAGLQLLEIGMGGQGQ